MARREHRREDLLRDARALVPRVQLHVELCGRTVEVFAGFRGDALSAYFDEDPVYHFTAAGELRRAFVDGRLLKAERRRLVALDRRRNSAEVVLQRDDLDAAAERNLLSRVESDLASLQEALQSQRFKLQGELPENGNGLARLTAWLGCRKPIVFAPGPRL